MPVYSYMYVYATCDKRIFPIQRNLMNANPTAPLTRPRAAPRWGPSGPPLGPSGGAQGILTYKKICFGPWGTHGIF